MRCPKCGFISFDNLEVCVKCKKNIKAVSDALRGTVYQVQSPTYLQLQPRQEEENAGDIAVAEAEVGEEYVDDDLEILIDEPQDKDKGDFEEDVQEETKAEEEDREIEIDFSQFEEAPEEGPTLAAEEPLDKPEDEPEKGLKEENTFKLEMPEALADISDLAPPAKNVEVNQEHPPVAQNSKGGFDLDELELNLDLDGLDMPAEAKSPAETELSLDDLDFSETLAQTPAKATPGKMAADMDEDLNFELDLGGLSIHKEQ